VDPLPYCEKCGAQVKEDDTFCPSCGAPVKAGAVRRGRRYRRYARGDDLCFGREEPRRDPLGLIEFGLFLLTVGVVYMVNPNILSEFVSWVELMGDHGVGIRPPATLITSAALFFGLIGLSNLLTAAIRVAIDKVWGRILPDVLAGAGFLVFAYVVNLYSQQVISWTNILAIMAIVLGALVILYTVMRNLY